MTPINPMTTFVQLHTLTVYPASCVVRDDLGRPKTALFGGVQRMRISSQSLKRAWRLSEPMAAATDGELSIRTRYVGSEALKHLTEAGVDQKKATKWAEAIGRRFDPSAKPSKSKKEDPPGYLPQIYHLSPRELDAIRELCVRLADEDRDPSEEELVALVEPGELPMDTALFGRFLANNRELRVDGAVQVAHAISTHGVDVEDDLWTAVDDLSSEYARDDDAGAGGMGTQFYTAGVMYGYVCVNLEDLQANLADNPDRARAALQGLLRAACTVVPRGKISGFGHYTRASYALVEVGSSQPRSLAAAFVKPVPVGDSGQLEGSIEVLRQTRTQLGTMYGDDPDSIEMSTEGGSLDELVAFAGRSLHS